MKYPYYLKQTFEYLLLFTAVVVLAAVVIPLVVKSAPYELLVVRSGSMEPNISTGSVIVALKEDRKFQEGETIVYSAGGTYVTHRVLGITEKDGAVSYQTKGDANEKADSAPVVQEQVMGSVFFSIPYVGKLLTYAQTAPGYFLMIVIPAFYMIVMSLMTIAEEVRKRGRSASVSSMSMVLLLVGVMGISTTFGTTRAYFTHNMINEGNTFSAADSFPTSQTIIINEVMWMGSTSHEREHWIELRNLTDENINIGNWTLENVKAANTDYQLPANQTIPANGFFLIANRPSSNPNVSIAVDPDVTNANLTLDDVDNGHLILKDTSDEVIDRAKGDVWPAGAHGGTGGVRQSMERKDLPGDGLVSDNWQTCETEGVCNSDDFWKVDGGNNYGTPKAANSTPGT